MNLFDLPPSREPTDEEVAAVADAVRVIVEVERDDASDLTVHMRCAMYLLAKYPGSTATTIGSELTGRRSAHGPQTSAREGGRTLWALKRRGFALRTYSEFDRKYLWSLTPEGERERKRLDLRSDVMDGVRS